MIKRLLFALCVAIASTGLTIGSARADAIDDTASVLDNVPSGTLPFSGNDVRHYKTMIQNCESAANFDQVILCVDNAAKDPQIGDAAGVPSWFPMLLNVYFDIKQKDYWGLLADAGEAVACAAAQILADGFDVCGVIKDLINTAKAIASAAEAVGKFFADLGAALGNLASGVACAISSLWGGCSDDGPPPTPPNVVAYQNYYFPRVQNNEGLNKRMADPNTWHGYAGQAPTDASAPIISAGVQAQMPKDGMIQALPAFWKAVYAQWDAKIGGEVIQKAKQAASQFNTPSTLNAYIAQGQAAWKGEYAFYGSFGNPVGVVISPLLKPGMDACHSAVENAGGRQVDDWIKEGRPQAIGYKNLSWPANYLSLCDDFQNQLKAALAPWGGQKAVDQAGCQLAGDGSNNYLCGNTEVTLACQNGMVTLGQPFQRCINKGPAPGEMPLIPYVCGGGVCKMYKQGSAPAGCKPLQLKDAQQLCKNGMSNGDGGSGGPFGSTTYDAKIVTPPSSILIPKNAADNAPPPNSPPPAPKPTPPASFAPAMQPGLLANPGVPTQPMQPMMNGLSPESQLAAAHCTPIPRRNGSYKCADPIGLQLCKKLQFSGKVMGCE